MASEPLSRSFRFQLAQAIVARIEHESLNQEQAAEALGLTRARFSALQHGDVDLISLDKLVDAATKLGLVVRMSVTRPYAQAG